MRGPRPYRTRGPCAHVRCGSYAAPCLVPSVCISKGRQKTHSRTAHCPSAHTRHISISTCTISNIKKCIFYRNSRSTLYTISISTVSHSQQCCRAPLCSEFLLPGDILGLGTTPRHINTPHGIHVERVCADENAQRGRCGSPDLPDQRRTRHVTPRVARDTLIRNPAASRSPT